MSEPPKVYLFSQGRILRDHACMSMAESGVILGGHLCSDLIYMRHDLAETPNRIADLHDYYPDGYHVVCLPDGEWPPDEVMARHQLLGHGIPEGTV